MASTAKQPVVWQAIVAVPALVVALVVFLVVWILPLGGVVVAAVIGLIVAGVLAAAAYWFADDIVLRSTGATPVDDGELVRIDNVIEELCLRVGLSQPALYRVEDGRPDAMAFGRRQPGAVIVTSGLVDNLALIELEGVLARALARIKSGELQRDTLAAVFLRAPLAPFRTLSRRVTEWVRGTDRDVVDDLAAVEVTRYPPGLLKALIAMRTTSAGNPPGSVITEHLWTRGPDHPAGVPGIFTLDDRIAVLREL